MGGWGCSRLCAAASMVSVVATVLTPLFCEGLGRDPAFQLPLYSAQRARHCVRLVAGRAVLRPAAQEGRYGLVLEFLHDLLKRLIGPEPLGPGCTPLCLCHGVRFRSGIRAG